MVISGNRWACSEAGKSWKRWEKLDGKKWELVWRIRWADSMDFSEDGMR